jgi:hypothetical protein
VDVQPVACKICPWCPLKSRRWFRRPYPIGGPPAHTSTTIPRIKIPRTKPARIIFFLFLLKLFIIIETLFECRTD